MTNSLRIGIAGGSGSGKSRLAHTIRSHFGTDKVSLLEQDWYYRDLSHLPPEEAAKNNFDHPDALELDLLQRQLEQLSRDEPIQAPQYDFSLFSRRPKSKAVAPAPLIVVEGLFVLHSPPLASLFDISVFVETPSDIRLVRRIRRDMRERGYGLERILEFWERDQFPGFTQFVEPQRPRASFIWETLEDRAFVPAFLADLQNRLARNADQPTRKR